MTEEEQQHEGGPMAAAREALQSFWTLLEKRLELAALEFQEQRYRWTNQIAWLAAVVVLGLMALFTLTILIIVLTWNTGARIWVIGFLVLAYGSGAAWCFLTLKRIVAQSPPPFAATIAEFKKDREWFQQKS
jgi:uncharacterized membrane protein YqjE